MQGCSCFEHKSPTPKCTRSRSVGLAMIRKNAEKKKEKKFKLIMLHWERRNKYVLLDRPLIELDRSRSSRLVGVEVLRSDVLGELELL